MRVYHRLTWEHSGPQLTSYLFCHAWFLFKYYVKLLKLLKFEVSVYLNSVILNLSFMYLCIYTWILNLHKWLVSMHVLRNQLLLQASWKPMASDQPSAFLFACLLVMLHWGRGIGSPVSPMCVLLTWKNIHWLLNGLSQLKTFTIR